MKKLQTRWKELNFLIFYMIDGWLPYKVSEIQIICFSFMRYIALEGFKSEIAFERLKTAVKWIISTILLMWLVLLKCSKMIFQKCKQLKNRKFLQNI